MLLRSPDEVLEALRARKETLQLSDAVVDHIAGLTSGHWDKACGPARSRMPNLFTLMVLCQTLGLAVQLVVDDEQTARVGKRWQRRRSEYATKNGRVSRAAIKKARPLVLAELARKGGLRRWAGISPEMKADMIAALNRARLAKRRAGTRKAA